MMHHYEGAFHLPVFHTAYDEEDDRHGAHIANYVKSHVIPHTYATANGVVTTTARLVWFQIRVAPDGQSRIEAVIEHVMPDGHTYNDLLIMEHTDSEHAHIFDHVKHVHNRQHEKHGMKPPHTLAKVPDV
jgi:hypothetical protein